MSEILMNDEIYELTFETHHQLLIDEFVERGWKSGAALDLADLVTWLIAGCVSAAMETAKLAGGGKRMEVEMVAYEHLAAIFASRASEGFPGRVH